MGHVTKNIGAGLRWGVAFAALYSGFVLLIALVGGSERFAAQGLTLTQVLTTYWLGGLFGGLVVGLLWPLGRWLPGAIIVGLVGAIPVFAVLTMMDKPTALWHKSDIVEILVLSAILGGGLGFLIWRDKRIH